MVRLTGPTRIKAGFANRFPAQAPAMQCPLYLPSGFFSQRRHKCFQAQGKFQHLDSSKCPLPQSKCLPHTSIMSQGSGHQPLKSWSPKPCGNVSLTIHRGLLMPDWGPHSESCCYLVDSDIWQATLKPGFSCHPLHPHSRTETAAKD